MSISHSAKRNSLQMTRREVSFLLTKLPFDRPAEVRQLTYPCSCLHLDIAVRRL